MNKCFINHYSYKQVEVDQGSVRQKDKNTDDGEFQKFHFRWMIPKTWIICIIAHSSQAHSEISTKFYSPDLPFIRQEIFPFVFRFGFWLSIIFKFFSLDFQFIHFMKSEIPAENERDWIKKIWQKSNARCRKQISILLLLVVPAPSQIMSSVDRRLLMGKKLDKKISK